MVKQNTVIGKLSFIDEGYLWCTYAKECIALISHPIMHAAVLANNEVNVYANSCEWCAHCINYECKYNTDKNISTVRELLKGEIEFNDEKINNLRNSLNDVTNDVKKNGFESQCNEGNIHSGVFFKEV